MRRQVAKVAIVVALGTVLWPATSHADSGAPELSGPSVYYYHPPELNRLSNPVRALIQGNHLPQGGCRFTSSVRSDGPYNTELELARDETTCVSLVVRGSAPPFAKTASSSTTYPGQGFAGVDSGADFYMPPCYPNCVFAADVYQTSQHSIDQWYTDPVGIHVTDDSTTIDWTTDISIPPPFCVPGVVGENAKAFNEAAFVNQWQQETGWAYDSNAWSETAKCPVYSQTVTSYSNHGFCAAAAGIVGTPIVGAIIGIFSPTDVSFTTRIDANNDGTATYTWTWGDSGACSGLLSHGFQTT